MNKSREYFIDILRILAATAVLVFHVMESSCSNDPQMPLLLRTLLTAISSSMKWHVPVFFMITGYLWLGNDKSCSYPRMWTAVRRFLIVLFTIGFAYALMEHIFTARTVSIHMIFYALSDVIRGNLWDHMWYLYAIIGVYLVLPIIKPYFMQSSPRSMSIFLCLLFVFTILAPVLDESIGYRLPVPFSITSPMFYVCAGGFIAKTERKSKQAACLPTAAFILSISLNCFLMLFLPQHAAWWSLLHCISAVSLFLSIKYVCPEMAVPAWICCLSDCSFGIYLFHPFFINLMIKLFHIYPLRWCPPVSIVLTSFLILAVSYLTTYFLRKISFIRKYIL